MLARFLLSSALVSLTSVVVPSVFAQEAQSGLPAPASAATGGQRESAGGELQDIVVTARKMTERLQDVPTAITAFSAEQLREREIRTAGDLQRNTPSLVVNGSYSAGRNSAAYSLRGIANAFLGTPGVVVYFAGAPTPANNQPIFYDLESVQVLKGPQGTLFGRTSTAGAVMQEPARANFNFEGNIEARLGNLNYRFIGGMINIPVIDNVLAVRVAGQWTKRSGYTLNLDDGRRFDDFNRGSIRLGVKFTPTSWITNDVLLQYDKNDENGTAFGLIAGNPSHGALNLPAGTLGLICSGGALQSGIGIASPSFAPFVQGCVAQRLAIQAAGRAAITAELNRRSAGGSVREFRGGPGLFYKSSSALFINNLNIKLGEIGPLTDVYIKDVFSKPFRNRSLTVQSIDGTNRQFLDQVSGPVYTPGVCQTSGPNIGQCTPGSAVPAQEATGSNWTNEINIGAKIANVFTVVGGYFYSRAKIDEYTRGISNGVLDNVTNPLLSLTVANAGVRYSRSSEKGVFVQGDLDLGWLVDGLSVTAGHRWTTVDSEALVPTVPFGTVFTRQVSASKGKTYTLSADWKVTSGILLYGRYATGFRPGGTNILCAVGGNALNGCTPNFLPETVKGPELGLKADYDFGPVRGRTNFAWFSTNYSNIQRSVSVGGVGYIANAAAAKISGFELEQVVAIDRLTLTGSYSHLNPRYTKFFGATPPAFPCTDPTNNSRGDCADLTGTPLPSAAKHQINLGIAYQLPVPESLGVITARANWYHQSSVFFTDTPADIQFSRRPPYSTINARLSWENAFSRGIDVALFMNNLTNKAYANVILNQYAALGITSAGFAEPRNFGIELRYRFGD